MIASVGTQASPLSTPGSHTSRSPLSLNAELNKYQGELADWVTCPSGKTPAGMAIIKQITAKLDAVKARIRVADQAPPTAPVIAPNTALNSAAKAAAIAASERSSDTAKTDSMPVPASSLDGRGHFVDLYA